jgi:hypothetical protein
VLTQKSQVSTPEACVPSSRFSDFSGFNTAGADFHSFVTAGGQFHPNGLQVWIENSGCSIVCVRNIIAKLGAFAANFTTFCHNY